VIGFDCVIRVSLGDLTGAGDQLVERPWGDSRAVGADLGRARPLLRCVGDESASRGHVPFLGDHNIDDLLKLIDCPVRIDPAPGRCGRGVIDKSVITGRHAARSCRVDQQGVCSAAPSGQWSRD